MTSHLRVCFCKQQQQQQQALHATFHPAASVDSVPPANMLVLGRPLDPVQDLGGQRGRPGLGHSAQLRWIWTYSSPNLLLKLAQALC